ncbi:MAG: cupin domain-containing protein [Pseudomonadota bacterium]
MSLNQYAEFIKRLPRADIPMAGLDAALLAGAHGQVVFFTLPGGASVPPHSHGEQWGIVVEGEIELTIDGQTRTYRRGDAYYVGDQVVHSGSTKEGCLAIDVFADPQRYQAKA